MATTSTLEKMLSYVMICRGKNTAKMHNVKEYVMAALRSTIGRL